MVVLAKTKGVSSYKKRGKNQMSIARGYVPVAKLDFNIMASRHALGKMGFPETEIDKVEIGLKARNKVLKSTKLANRNIQKLFKGEKEELPILSEPIVCDICRGSTGIGIAKLTSPEQEAKIPSGWLLAKFGRQDEHRIYAIIPPAIVIDYNGGKVYTVCGTCQLVLGLEPTESGLLIQAGLDGRGFVDLDKIEKLVKNYEGD